MATINYKTLGGIILALIVTASATYYIAKTEGYKTCQMGVWEPQDDGMSKCSSNGKLEVCYSISNSRCYLGKIVKVEVPVNQSGGTATNNTIILTGKYISCQGRVWLIDDVAVVNDSTKIFNTNLEKRLGDCK